MSSSKPPITSEELVNPPIRDVDNLASARDCTGLVPRAIADDEEAENYARLYAIHMQKPTRPRP